MDSKKHSKVEHNTHVAGHEATSGKRGMIIQPGVRDGKLMSNGPVPGHPYQGYRPENGGQGPKTAGINRRLGTPAGVDGGVTKKGND